MTCGDQAISGKWLLNGRPCEFLRNGNAVMHFSEFWSKELQAVQLDDEVETRWLPQASGQNLCDFPRLYN